MISGMLKGSAAFAANTDKERYRKEDFFVRDVCIHTGELLLPNQTVDLDRLGLRGLRSVHVAAGVLAGGGGFGGGQALRADRLILPEIYLARPHTRIPKIHETMRAYLAGGVLTPRVQNGFVLVERSTGEGARLGLVAMLDLECYDYRAGTRKPVRATEGTVAERIPARLAVRKRRAAGIEPRAAFIRRSHEQRDRALFEKRAALETLYDFPLMMDGGHITGYAVTDPRGYPKRIRRAGRLAQRSDMLFAVGDGNHSLAAAKDFWDGIKQTLSPEAQGTHPARFAMVEIGNIHDDSLCFEPIHRVLYGFDGDELLSELEAYAVQKGWTLAGAEDAHGILVAYEGKEAELNIGQSGEPLAAGALQTFLDEWMRDKPGLRLDYVHGEETARALAAQDKTVAFLLPALHKDELFPAVDSRWARCRARPSPWARPTRSAIIWKRGQLKP